MVDYPGKVAAVVFTPGCNMNCHYCHNRALIESDPSQERHDPEDVLAFLTRRRKMLDGVVVTGGEPTLQPCLANFLERVRDLGLAIKLDTNGTRPEVVRNLLERELVDFVAMDVKAPFERYGEICGVEVDPEDLHETIKVVLDGGIGHEFRTTFSPLLNEQDILQMAGVVRGARGLVLQQYRRPVGDLLVESALPSPSHTAEYVRNVAMHVTTQQIPCTTRGL
jgi:pyruvate formate lyase activating enzyme